MNKPLTAILLGAGGRGMSPYGEFALKNPEKLNYLAVAEPIDRRREKFANLHNIEPKHCYKTWEDALKLEKFADIVIVATMDQMHTGPALLALERGYDVLLEKPMAHNLKDCIKIVQKVEKEGRILGVGHVLRYTQFFSKIHEVIQSGALGTITNITHRENVSWFHMAHSFVRGNWRNVETSSPMILAKCCHDLDILYWLVDSKPKTIASQGNLIHFKSENAPKGAPKYCVEGCPAQKNCLYYAPSIYIDGEPFWQGAHKSGRRLYKKWMDIRKFHTKRLDFYCKIIPLLKQLRYFREWPVSVMYENQKEDYSDESKMKLLKTSPYGRCVYQCDNDVVDHQMVQIEFENGVLANLTMHGFSEQEGRTIRIDGTRGTLIGEFNALEKITLYDHFSGMSGDIHGSKLKLSTAGHGGGDPILIDMFLDAVRQGKSQPMTNARASLESHLMAFAAEEARLKDVVINMEDYRKKSENL